MIFPDRVLGRSSVNTIDAGRAMGPITFLTWFPQFLQQLAVPPSGSPQGDEGGDGLSGYLVLAAHHRRFGHGLVGDQG